MLVLLRRTVPLPSQEASRQFEVVLDEGIFSNSFLHLLSAWLYDFHHLVGVFVQVASKDTLVPSHSILFTSSPRMLSIR